jgi:hypothetical protein
MDEKETLIRVEQQLQDSIKNQGLILSDLKEIFSKIEIESKSTAIVKSDLNTHLEMTVVRREEDDRRFRQTEEKLKEIYLALEEEKKQRIAESNDSKIFQKQITTSISLLKWIVGLLFLIISTVWPILTFFVDKKP